MRASPLRGHDHPRRFPLPPPPLRLGSRSRRCLQDRSSGSDRREPHSRPTRWGQGTSGLRSRHFELRRRPWRRKWLWLHRPLLAHHNACHAEGGSCQRLGSIGTVRHRVRLERILTNGRRGARSRPMLLGLGQDPLRPEPSCV